MVSVNPHYKGAYAFSGVKHKIKNIKWMDNGESFNFIQSDMLQKYFFAINFHFTYFIFIHIMITTEELLEWFRFGLII